MLKGDQFTGNSTEEDNLPFSARKNSGAAGFSISAVVFFSLSAVVLQKVNTSAVTKIKKHVNNNPAHL